MTDELKNRAYDILERSPSRLSIERVQWIIENEQRIYDCLYSDIIQRKRALDNIEIYTFIGGLLSRAAKI